MLDREREREKDKEEVDKRVMGGWWGVENGMVERVGSEGERSHTREKSEAAFP